MGYIKIEQLANDAACGCLYYYDKAERRKSNPTPYPTPLSKTEFSLLFQNQ